MEKRMASDFLEATQHRGHSQTAMNHLDRRVSESTTERVVAGSVVVLAVVAAEVCAAAVAGGSSHAQSPQQSNMVSKRYVAGLRVMTGGGVPSQVHVEKGLKKSG